jgi:hypothetical protein
VNLQPLIAPLKTTTSTFYDVEHLGSDRITSIGKASNHEGM